LKLNIPPPVDVLENWWRLVDFSAVDSSLVQLSKICVEAIFLDFMPACSRDDLGHDLPHAHPNIPAPPAG
jgi:hypothetical protein